MIINISTVIGLSLATLIVTYLIVWGIGKKQRGEPLLAADKVGIAVFSLWATAIYLDVIFYHGYTFTVVNGINFRFGRS